MEDELISVVVSSPVVYELTLSVYTILRKRSKSWADVAETESVGH